MGSLRFGLRYYVLGSRESFVRTGMILLLGYCKLKKVHEGVGPRQCGPASPWLNVGTVVGDTGPRQVVHPDQKKSPVLCRECGTWSPTLMPGSLSLTRSRDLLNKGSLGQLRGRSSQSPFLVRATNYCLWFLRLFLRFHQSFRLDKSFYEDECLRTSDKNRGPSSQLKSLNIRTVFCLFISFSNPFGPTPFFKIGTHWVKSCWVLQSGANRCHGRQRGG